jgi:CRISPR/Cas system-associated exonuclease Cas4 (RecB family)
MGDDPLKSRGVTHPLLKVHDNIMQLNSWLPERAEVVAVNFPLQRSFKEFDIEDKLDVVLARRVLNSRATEVEVIILDDGLTRSNDKDLGSTLRAQLGSAYVRREFTSASTTIKTILLNVYHNERKEITLSRDQKMNYPRIIKGLVTSISNKHVYPRASYDTCKYCCFTYCLWRQSKKNVLTL